jgi:hypothetical protein
MWSIVALMITFMNCGGLNEIDCQHWRRHKVVVIVAFAKRSAGCQTDHATRTSGAQALADHTVQT